MLMNVKFPMFVQAEFVGIQKDHLSKAFHFLPVLANEVEL